jgi:hypothetical protein
MKINGLNSTTHIISQEGGISIDECINMLENDTITPETLKECNFNPNDPNKESTKCRINRGAIGYKVAKEVFEKYYNEINTTDSGRIRGKMFDIKYNKKNKKLLYPDEPCSEKYLEPDGPKKYDMWLVDAFPEAENVNIDKGVNISTQHYSADDNISPDLKYGPMITYGHLFNKNYDEVFDKYLLETRDLTEAQELAEQFALEKTSSQLKDTKNLRLFNQYFSKISIPIWLKDYKNNLVRNGFKPIHDLNSDEFKQSILNARRKRDIKKEQKDRQSTQPVFSAKTDILDQKIEPAVIEELLEINIPELELEIPEPIVSIEEIFKQPITNSTDKGLIDSIDKYRTLIVVDITESPTLFDEETNYLYKLPFKNEFIETSDYNTIENIFTENTDYLFEILEKPITPFAILTYNGIKDL